MCTRAALAIVVLALFQAKAADTREGIEFFEKNVRPVLVQRCYPCHGSDASSGGLRLDSAQALRRGGKSGPVVVPGEPEHSLLVTAIRSEGDLKMPPGKPLAPEQIADFETWISMGAPDPRVIPPRPEPPPYNFEQARKFWSFQPVKDSNPPKVSAVDWNKTPIDRFVKAKLDEKHLTPLGPASKIALIRRATYDLTGLPPTPAEVSAFLSDRSAQAFERLIDRLLATPQYGERWGRHWLDLVRYADTSGCNADFPVADAYRYRNWVIQAFNKDQPYDRFLQEQIAGDLLPPADETPEGRYERIIATGYLAIARRFGSGNHEFHLTIEDTIDNVGKVMLGLSVACARCHNHKFDPIPTCDYYALYGIFQSTKYAFPGTETFPHSKDFVALAAPEQAAKLAAYQDEASGLDHRIDGFNGSAEAKDLSPEQRAKEIQRMWDRVAELDRSFPQIDKAYAVSDGKPGNARIQRGGDPGNRGPSVPRGFLQILGGQTLPAEETGSGRRELAGWITDPANPLMARVMVNRIWQHHFGKGIVGTPNDFGARGDPPTNPALLDYLAVRFRESGYSVKAMHRLIMRTRVYQMASGPVANASAIDPKNEFLWHFEPRRLDAEEIRDSILAVAGDLDPSMGGRHPFPPENTFKFTQHDQFFAVYDTRQRSVYLMQQRLRRHPFLEIFDGADPNASTPTRTPGETSLQALAMMNSAFVEEQAALLATRVTAAYSAERDRITYAYRLVYGRPPRPDELQECVHYLAKAGLPSLMHVLLASNEFVFLD